MTLKGIIAISGRPGLFKVVAQGKNNVIVESIVDQKRLPAYATDRLSALEDISIYTYDEDHPLIQIFESIFKKEGGKSCISHKESANKLSEYLMEIVPNYDQERVYSSDIKKIFQWYNLLITSGDLKLEDEKPVEEAKAEGEEKKAATAKKPAATKAPVAKKPPVKKATATKSAAKKPVTKKPSSK
jgi:hypothetical protein